MGIVAGIHATVNSQSILFSEVMLLPESAIHRGDEQPWCLVASADGSGYQKRTLTLGAAHGSSWIVEAGLQAGERVLLREGN